MSEFHSSPTSSFYVIPNLLFNRPLWYLNNSTLYAFLSNNINNISKLSILYKVFKPGEFQSLLATATNKWLNDCDDKNIVAI